MAGFGELAALTGLYFNPLGSRVTINRRAGGAITAPHILAGKPTLVTYPADYFRVDYGFREMPIEEAFLKARRPVEVDVGGGRIVTGLPGFGALDAANVHPYASGIQNGLNLLDGIGADATGLIVDIGAAGYGSTSMIILSLLDEKLRDRKGKHGKVTVHLVDPSFGPEWDRLATMRPALFKLHQGQMQPALSDTSKSYLPPDGMPAGYSTLRLFEEHPSLLNRLEQCGVQIDIHRMGSDEFFEAQSKSIGETTILVSIDGNHGMSLENTGVVQPLQDLTHAAGVLAPGGIIVVDDYKPTPNCGLAMMAVNVFTQLAMQGEEAPVEAAICSALNQLTLDLGSRLQEWRDKFPGDPKQASDILVDPDKLWAACTGMNIVQYGDTPVVVLQRPIGV